MPLKPICRLILLVFLLPYSIVMAQNVTLKNYKQKNGLPSNEVYDIFQDKNGVMWFATDRGLANYNGTQFKKFELKDGLTDITVFDFFPQENDQIWCTTFNGKLFYFENGSEKFIPYRYNNVIENFFKEKKLPGSLIISLAVDAQNALHFFMASGFYLKIDAKGTLTYISEIKLPTEKPRYFHYKAINKKQGIEYFSKQKSVFPPYAGIKESIKRFFSFKGIKVVYSERSVWIYPKNKKPFLISGKNSEPLESGEYDVDHFWISYRGKGIVVYDTNGAVVKRGLNGHSVSRVFKDNFNSRWFSTVDGGVFYEQEVKINKNILKGTYIHSLTRNEEGELFIGCYNGDVYKRNIKGALVLLHRGLTNKPAIVQYYKAEKCTYYMVDEMLYTDTGKKMICTGGVLKASDDTPVPIISRFGLLNVIEDVQVRKTDTLLFRIHDVSEHDGNYYAAWMKGIKVSKGGKKYVTINNRLLNYRFDDMDYEPERKVFYLASLGGGVVVYNPHTGKTMSIDKSKGLSDDLVTEVYIEDKNTIWACTNYGLNRITFNKDGTFKVHYITTSDGLSENQIRDVEIVKDTIYVATANGLCSIAKNNFETIFNKRKYFLRLSSIAINNTILEEPAKQLSLSYDRNQLNFGVESVAYGRKEQVYRYKLKGLHENWNYTSDRKIAYEFIPPGHYELQVQVLEDNRLFSDEMIRLPITIRNPFWITWWFIIIVTAGVTALIYLFFRIRVLTYNKDIIRELLRLWVRKIKKKEKYFVFKEQGKEIRIPTNTILYVKSSGNYMDIVTEEKVYVMRCKIGDFISKVPDPLEFLRVHRSYIIRIDKVEQKTKKMVLIKKQEIPVGETYLEELDKIVF